MTPVRLTSAGEWGRGGEEGDTACLRRVVALFCSSVTAVPVAGADSGPTAATWTCSGLLGMQEVLRLAQPQTEKEG